jgi:hypothetical protein
MAQEEETQHALLIAWGQFAQEIGLIAGIEAVKIKQKTVEHTPQTKVLEFLVAILAGIKHLQDISRAGHPLDQDTAVAKAWGRATWADYTGISRTLTQLSWDEVRAVVRMLEQVSQPFLERELGLLSGLEYDGDLTGLPVSNTSKSYPGATYGHMSDEIRLGYQAGLVSLNSPTYGRLWLSVEHHAGDTVSCTQAENLIRAAEKRTGQRPKRRTGLLKQRIEAFVMSREPAEKRLAAQQARLEAARQSKSEALTQLRALQDAPVQKPKRIATLERRCVRRDKAIAVALGKLEKTIAWLKAHLEQETLLRKRLEQFESDNVENLKPVCAGFRLDAGFGTYDNLALLIEMGYEVYVKLHNHQITRMLRDRVTNETEWSRVGDNAEMVAWKDFQPKNFSYTLDVALERFHTGKTLKHSTLAHFGDTPVTTNLSAWFGKYNARQTIEAGIKETKQVFCLHKLKVRSEPAIFLQEALTIFAANFIRWATIWIEQNAVNDEQTLPIATLGIKRQVQVAANTSAKVIQNSDGMLVRFSPASVFAGKQLIFRRYEKPGPTNHFFALFTFFNLIAQKLR